MVAQFSNNFRVFNAERFVESISGIGADSPNVYLTVGKPTTWANEASPPLANTSRNASIEVWRYMMGAKKVTGNDVRQAIPRYDWAENTEYTAYDNSMDSSDLANTQFYVLTDEWNVYKCISNNNGSLSTVKPTSILTTGSVETADNYVWKYMYTLTGEERLRYTTSGYIPVRTLTEDNGSLQWQVQDNAIDGGIEAIFVSNTGSGYANANSISITITGDGAGANATARINTTTNVISSIIVTSPGSGYSYANVVISDSGTGTGAQVRAIIAPSGGHGSNPTRELGGSYVMMNIRVRGTEGNKIPIDNEFRQIALIRNPIRRGTSNVASNTVYSQVTTLTLDSGVTSYDEDEIVYQGTSLATATFRGTVLGWDASNNVIKLVDVTGTAQADILNGETSKAVRLVQSVTPYDLTPFSGELLYIDNIVPIQRASDQTEDFKIIIQF